MPPLPREEAGARRCRLRPDSPCPRESGPRSWQQWRARRTATAVFDHSSAHIRARLHACARVSTSLSLVGPCNLPPSPYIRPPPHLTCVIYVHEKQGVDVNFLYKSNHFLNPRVQLARLPACSCARCASAAAAPNFSLPPSRRAVDYGRIHFYTQAIIS